MRSWGKTQWECVMSYVMIWGSLHKHVLRPRRWVTFFVQQVLATTLEELSDPLTWSRNCLVEGLRFQCGKVNAAAGSTVCILYLGEVTKLHGNQCHTPQRKHMSFDVAGEHYRRGPICRGWKFCRELYFGHSAKKLFAERRSRQIKPLGKHNICREPNPRQTDTLGKQIP
jgi:hypothetical protein